MTTMLKNALVANAVFSGTTGIGAIVFAGLLAESLGPPAWSLRALGAGLVGFAAIVARESLAPQRRRARQIVAADAAWVAAAAIIILAAPGWLTGAGRSVLATVTASVALLAAAQWRGLEAST